MSEAINQPNVEEQKEYDSIVENSADYVEVRGKKWKVKWVRQEAKRKITSILLSDSDELQKNTKCVAALRLNRYFLIKLFYWILWRWYYYVKEYTDLEILPYLNLCKKKVGLGEYLLVTTLLTEMKDSIMAQTREEVEHFLLAQRTAQRGHSQKNTNT